MSTLKEEILSLKESLKQLELGRRNVIQHLQVHEDNYAATFRQFVEKVEQLLIVVQEGQIDKLASHNCVWKLEYLVLMKTILHFSA